jgi:hypothetical protein
MQVLEYVKELWRDMQTKLEIWYYYQIEGYAAYLMMAV